MRRDDSAGARRSLNKTNMLGMHEPGLFAEPAFYEGDVQGIQHQLDLGQSNWGNLSDWHPFYEASALYLRGEKEKAEELFTPLQENTEGKYSVSLLKSFIASVMGDLDTSVACISEDLSETAYVKLREIQTPCFYSKLCPDYRSYPGYQKMLREYGLDETSVAKLRMPPLPF